MHYSIITVLVIGVVGVALVYTVVGGQKINSIVNPVFNAIKLILLGIVVIALTKHHHCVLLDCLILLIMSHTFSVNNIKMSAATLRHVRGFPPFGLLWWLRCHTGFSEVCT